MHMVAGDEGSEEVAGSDDDVSGAEVSASCGGGQYGSPGSHGWPGKGSQ